MRMDQITANGMKPDPAKIQALHDLPAPEMHTKLHSVLRLINYLQPFLPDLASKTTFFRDQERNRDWTPSKDTAFRCLKQLICSTLLKTTLAYHDCTKPVQIHTDASEYGLCTALI